MAGRDLQYDQITLANGQTVSAAFEFPAGLSPLGCYLPSNFSGTALTMKSGKNKDDNFAVVNGFSKTVTANTRTYVPFTPGDVAGIGALQLVSGTSQSGAATIEIVYGQIRG
jgi:hypothetical protein